MPKIEANPTNIDEKKLLEEMNKLRSVSPWMLAFYIPEVYEATTEPLSNFNSWGACVSNTEDLVWDGVTFKAYPFTVDNIPQSTSGSFPTTRLSLFNSSEFVNMLDLGSSRGLIGKTLTLFFINWDGLGSYTRDTYPLQYTFKINGTVINQVIGLILGAPRYLANKLPTKKYIRDYCNFIFLGNHCWMKDFYDELLSLDGDIERDCDKSYLTCRDYWHRAKTVEDSLSGTLPRSIRYGGFPTVAMGDINYF